MTHPGAGLDLRLVPAAASVWLVCGWGVGARENAVWLVVLGLLVAAAAGLRRLRRRVLARHRRSGNELLAAAVLALLVAALVLGTVAVRGSVRAELVAESGDASGTVTVQLQREARPHQQGAIADALLLEVDGRAGQLRAPVVVLGGADWLDLPFGTQVHTQARLAATTPGDDRVFLVIADSIDAVQAPAGWRAQVADVRAGLAELCAPLPPAGRGLVPGIALAEDMRTVSLTHLTAISGAHVALLLAVLMVLLLWAPRWLRAALGAVALVAFVALVRPEGSVLRAAVMGGVLLLGLLLRRPRSGLPALAVAVVVLIAADPWITRSYGFALSVLATGGLLLLAPLLTTWLSRWLPTPLAAAIAIPVAAQLTCLPVLLLLQPNLPVYGVLANVLAAPPLATTDAGLDERAGRTGGRSGHSARCGRGAAGTGGADGGGRLCAGGVLVC